MQPKVDGVAVTLVYQGGSLSGPLAVATVEKVKTGRRRFDQSLCSAKPVRPLAKCPYRGELFWIHENHIQRQMGDEHAGKSGGRHDAS